MVTPTENQIDTYFIGSLARDVKLKPYTRAIARAYEAMLLKGVIVKSGGETDTPAINGSKAEEEMIRLLFDLSIEDMDIIDNSDYLELKKIVETSQAQKKSESVESSEKSKATLAETATE